MQAEKVKTFSQEKQPAKRRKMGRPRKKATERLSVERTFGFRPSDAKKMDEAAASAGKDFRSWAREILVAAVADQ